MPCKLKIVQISFELTCAHHLVHEQPPRLDRKPLHQRHHQAPYWDRLTWYRFRLCPLSSTSTPSRSTTPTFPEVPTTCSSMQAGPNLASCVYMYMYLHACIAQIQEDACVYYDKIQHCADVWEGVQIRSGNNSRRSRPQHHHGSDASATTTTTPRARPTASSHKQAIQITSTMDHVDHVPSSSAELRPRRPRPEQLCRAPTTSTTRLRRNDDRREERRYDDRDHSHDDRSKSSRTGQLHRQRHVKPSLEHRNTPTTPTGHQ